MRVVDSHVAADIVVRETRSAATADCVIEWTDRIPGPGQWREVDGFADFDVAFSSSHADLSVHFE